MKASELYNFPETVPTPSNIVEACILGVHIMHYKLPKGEHIVRVPLAWMDALEAGELFANGFEVSTGWHVAYEKGWIIKW